MWKSHPTCFEYFLRKNKQIIINDVIGDDNYYLMQFTGLKDVNDKEVYEGDILEKQAFDGQEYTLRSVVVWDRGGFCLKIIKHHNPEKIGVLISFPDGKIPKIIGNIHENPKLLEE